MKVLVTGATGFVGRAAVRTLSEVGAFEIVAASRRPMGRAVDSGLCEVSVDLLQPGAAEALIDSVRPTHLLHLAWNARPGVFWTSRDNLDWSAASLRLASAFVAAGGSRAVFAGSCSEYDWTTGEGRLSEASPVMPATLYGVAKDATRRVVSAAGAAFGVPTAWARLFWLYGPDEAPGRLVSDVAAALARGVQVAVGDGTGRRDYMHVDDAAAALAVALHGDHHGPFNIGSGQAVALGDVVRALAGEAKRPDLVRWGALPARAGDPPCIEADVTCLRSVIGAPQPRPIAQGLAETFAWWRRQVGS